VVERGARLRQDAVSGASKVERWEAPARGRGLSRRLSVLAVVARASIRAVGGNKVVARYRDGHIVRGFTQDFVPNREVFHLVPEEGPAAGKPVLVQLAALKAVFFVKDLHGDPQRNERKEFDLSKPVIGKKIRVVFSDGEVLLGTTHGYQPGRPGFFLAPADPESNVDRCFVVTASTREIALL
jgi:hypothetical protein